MKDVAEMKAYSMGFLGLFCWFLIEQAIPTSDSLFGWPAWRVCVWEAGEQGKKTFCREKHATLKALDSTRGCVHHVHGGAPLLKAQTKESLAPVPLVPCLNSALL